MPADGRWDLTRHLKGYGSVAVGKDFIDQPPFSFYLAHGDIHLFESSEEFLAGKRFVAEAYVKQAVTS